MSNDNSVFLKKSNNKQSTPLQTGIGSLFDKVKGYVKLNSNDEEANIKQQEENLTFFQKITKCLKNSIEVEISYKTFFIIFATGISLILLSLLFFPLVWITPQKFVSLFSLGCLVTLLSFIFISGTSAYLEMLFGRKRAALTILFLISIFLGIYFSFNKTYYIISLICACLQMITLIVFTLSFIPGGGLGIYFIKNMMMSPLNYFLRKMKIIM
jgi:hypothetical protein